MRDTPIIAGATACLFSLALFLHWWLPVKWHTTRSDCLLSLEMSLTPNDLSHMSDAEFHALCPQGEHAPGPEPLSPAAQAIVAAMHRSYDHEPTRRAIAAAILRALADRLQYKGVISKDGLIAIATELESTDD